MSKRGGFIPDAQTSINARKAAARQGNPYNFIDETGQRYGRLTVVGVAPERYKNEAVWICRCDCTPGSTFEVRGMSLRNGETRSCGCLHREYLQKRNHDNANPKREEYKAIAAELRAKGLSYAKIVEEFNNRNIEPLSGKPGARWYPGTVKWLLDD